jgi:hypothetical protein
MPKAVGATGRTSARRTPLARRRNEPRLEPREEEALRLLHNFAQESRHKPPTTPLRSRSGNRYVSSS